MMNSGQQATFMSRFFQQESAGGILLMLMTCVALVVANSPLFPYYQSMLSLPFMVALGPFELEKPLLLWVNDGLMSIFFLLVGLELKREFLEGELADRKMVVLPAVGALGGMLVPALIYVAFNWRNDMVLRGWAIPAATDIAFALGVLSLLGSRVPVSIKVFLSSLAIFDDIGAILIIALFYTHHISYEALWVVALCMTGLLLLNAFNVVRKKLYILLGLIMWLAMLKSGVHATISGVLLAMFIPMRSTYNRRLSPLRRLEHALHPWVAFGIVPIFALFNAGIRFNGMGSEQVLHSVPIGIALGLFVGKQLGVFVFAWAAIHLGWAALPKTMSWRTLYGTAALCGIGFTMSLFIGGLAFEMVPTQGVFDERTGILAGSIVSAILGYVILRFSLLKRKAYP